MNGLDDKNLPRHPIEVICEMIHLPVSQANATTTIYAKDELPNIQTKNCITRHCRTTIHVHGLHFHLLELLHVSNWSTDCCYCLTYF